MNSLWLLFFPSLPDFTSCYTTLSSCFSVSSGCHGKLPWCRGGLQVYHRPSYPRSRGTDRLTDQRKMLKSYSSLNHSQARGKRWGTFPLNSGCKWEGAHYKNPQLHSVHTSLFPFPRLLHGQGTGWCLSKEVQRQRFLGPMRQTYAVKEKQWPGCLTAGVACQTACQQLIGTTTSLR